MPSKDKIPAQVLKFYRRNLDKRAGLKVCGRNRRHYSAEAAGTNRGERLRE